MNTKTIKKLHVLFEDNHCIVVLKPAGIPVAPDNSGDESLFDMVKTYLKETYQKPGNVFLGLVHRLDRPVSGVVVFAKTSKGAARLSEQFRLHSVKKIYHALVFGIPRNPSGIIRSFIEKRVSGSSRRAVVRDDGVGEPAELSYETVKHSAVPSGYTLLKIQLKTGKFHQIRSQLASIGLPIVGDQKYHAKIELAKGTIALCATELTFRAPTGERMVHVRTPLPKEWF